MQACKDCKYGPEMKSPLDFLSDRCFHPQALFESVDYVNGTEVTGRLGCTEMRMMYACGKDATLFEPR